MNRMADGILRGELHYPFWDDEKGDMRMATKDLEEFGTRKLQSATVIEASNVSEFFYAGTDKRRRPTINDQSIVEYEGLLGMPSYCQVAHWKNANRLQFALIHMPNGGTVPTNMFESLATHLRQKFYPDTDAGFIDWFDVVPQNGY